MAVDLGMDTICEGVETAEQVEFLRDIGCSKQQGYYYCKPIPFEEILERYQKGIQIGFEDPAETDYYAAIGRVNLYDLTVITDKENDSTDYFDTLPAGILELKEDQACYVRTNQAYRDFMKKYFDFDLSDHPCGSSARTDGVDPVFMEKVRQCCADWSRTFLDTYLPNGSAVHAAINPISRDAVTGAAALAVVVLSISEPNDTTYADIARALASDYYNIYVIDLDTDAFIEYSSQIGGEELSVIRRGEDFFGSVNRDTMTRIYEEDRAPFLNLFSKESVIRDLDAQGVFTTTYRLIDTGAPMYVNMKITRMPGGNRIIMGISIIDAQMKNEQQLRVSEQ